MEDESGVMTEVATLRGLKLRIRDRVLRETVALPGGSRLLWDGLSGPDPHAWVRSA
jgi:hypothetical protein